MNGRSKGWRLTMAAMAVCLLVGTTARGQITYPEWWNTPTWQATGTFNHVADNLIDHEIWLNHVPAPNGAVVAAVEFTYTQEGGPGIRQTLSLMPTSCSRTLTGNPSRTRLTRCWSAVTLR